MPGYYDYETPSNEESSEKPTWHMYGGSQDRTNKRYQGNRTPRPEVDTSVMTPEELFDYRKGYRLNFGKYKGLSLNEIASIRERDVDTGLAYLGWLWSIQGEESWPPLREALRVFLSRPQVQKDVEAALNAITAARPKGRY